MYYYLFTIFSATHSWIWLAQWKIKNASKKFFKEFLRWINSDDFDTVCPTPDLRSLIYYHGMRSVGGEKEWNKMFTLFEKEQDASEKTKLQLQDWPQSRSLGF